MRPTLIPDEEVGTIEGSTRAQIMPPHDDFDSGVSAVEVLRHDGPFGPAVSLRIELEDEDLERIARGERVWWLTWNSSVLVPFSLTWPDPVETPEGALRLVGCSCGMGPEAAIHRVDCEATLERWTGTEWVPHG